MIIPTKDRKELLTVTLDNILAQSRVPDEIIVVDDHSVDETRSTIQEKYSGKVKIIDNEGHGPGAARNTGVKMANGHYIKFFDSDDIMSLNTIETQLKALEDSDEAMVYSPYVHATFENDQWIQKDVIIQYSPIPKKMTLRDCMAYGFFTVIPAMMFKRDFLNKVGSWREDIVAYEDWDYLWRIGKYVKAPLHTNGCLMVYRVHGHQTTQRHFDDVKRDKDKLECLNSILADDSITYRQKLLLKSELSHTRSLLDIAKLAWNRDRLLLLWKRIRNKRERSLTRTNWERMHGIQRAKDIFDFNQLCWVSKN